MKHLRWFSIFTFTALVLAGCGKTSSLQAPGSGGTQAGTDEAQVASVLAGNPDYVNEPVWQDEASLSLEVSTDVSAAIRPLRFWRLITSVESDIHTEFGSPDPNGRPTLALVTIRRRLSGSFNIVAATVVGDDTTRTLVQKPLHDLWTRKLALVRMPVPDDTVHSRWRLAGTSGVEVHTRDGVTRIQSLRIESGPLDTTVTDPLELHRLRHILKLAPAAEVRLTATTASAGDVVLFHGHDQRRRFRNNGDGTHSFVFPSGTFPGLRHFGVDALSNGTLFDDAAAYDSNAWILAYAVVATRAPLGN